ncbi:MAG TPA: phytanoyl-CoA dioxygenase family protein [Thermoanaerobaculia bacterium]|nr:phytanoyl-CoA dioxygenase family protein [Thermoanaerobaculia bacterium]
MVGAGLFTRLGRKKDDWKKHLAELSRFGVSVMDNFLDGRWCDELIERFDALESIAKPYDNDRRIFAIERISSVHFHTYADSKILNEIGVQYTGVPQELLATMAAKLYADPNALGSGGGWHRDSFLPQYKAICYLTDVTADNGPFEYIPGSQRLKNKFLYDFRSRLRRGPVTSRYEQAEIDEYCSFFDITPRVFTAPRGTVILVDSSGLHRGRPIKEGIRYALTNYYKSSRLLFSERGRDGGIYGNIDETLKAYEEMTAARR